MFESIKCVTLDLDDTLWPIEPTISRAERKLYEWIQENYPQVTNEYSMQDIADKRQALSAIRDDIAHNVTAIRYASLEELADEFGYSKEFSEEGFALFRKYRNQVEPFEHSESVLAILKKSFTLGAITNGNAQLEQISIGSYFDFVVSAEEVGASKPAPELFLQAANKAGVSIGEIVHIGDSARIDVVGALNAGCKAIWFNNNRQAWPGGQNPHAVIHCLSELPFVLNI